VVTGVPALHDVDELGYVVQGAGRSVYFAGDTRLHDQLPAIAERFKPTLAILPVDGTRMRGGRQRTMTPDDALAAARTLAARAVMPGHGEAVDGDPLVHHLLLARTFLDGGERFAAAVASALPGVACLRPAPGELLPI
jgi:L-ascorbate metabolism protein UlaG (beta-lactamase superfamily)